MARFGKREPTRETGADPGDAAEQVAAAAHDLAADRADEGATPGAGASDGETVEVAAVTDAEHETEVVAAADAEGETEVVAVAVTEIDGDGKALTAVAVDDGEGEAVTEVRSTEPLPIPPLLTEVEPQRAIDGNELADRVGLAREKAAEHAGAAREKAAEHAGAAREKAAEHAGAVRDKAAEHAAAAREKLAGGAGEARERLAEGAAEAKVRGAKMRKRFAEAAADARDTASSAAAEARDRVASTDVNEFAHSTTRLIDTARPFFLAGFAVVFAILGFLEGDAGTAELFVGGSILFVIGAGFSGEINAFISHRFHHTEESRHEPDEHRTGGHHRGPDED